VYCLAQKGAPAELKEKRHARPQKKKKGTRARAFQQYRMGNAEAIPKTKLVKKNIFLPELAPDRKLVCGQGGGGTHQSQTETYTSAGSKTGAGQGDARGAHMRAVQLHKVTFSDKPLNAALLCDLHETT